MINEGINWETTENIFIEGDNLEVLKLLLKSYFKKVKLIYIDPPYNTGKDFIYNDNYSDPLKKYLEETKQIIDGEIQSSNFESGGKYHTNWLNMMYPRLKLARNFLTEDGVIFISIDDNEIDNLKKIMEELYGDNNFIACLPTVMNLKGNNDEFGFAGTHEYTLVYAFNKEKCKLNEWLIDDDEILDWDEDEYGLFKKGANLKATGGNAPREKRPNLFFPIYVDLINGNVDIKKQNDTDIEIYPITDGNEMSWRWRKEKIVGSKKDIIISVSKNQEISLYKKQRPGLGDVPTKKPKTIFYKPEYSSGNGTLEVKELLGEKVFKSPPKPISLIKDIILIGSENDSIILDFFAGSGTTGHAVMDLNREFNSDRKFILVQLPEHLDQGNKDHSNAINYCKKMNVPYKLSELTKIRLKKSSEKNLAMEINQSRDYGYKVFFLDSSNIKDWDNNEHSIEENLRNFDVIKKDRTQNDIVYEIMLKFGIELSADIEKIWVSEYEFFIIDNGKIIVCLNDVILSQDVDVISRAISEIIKSSEIIGDNTCIFLDSCFKDDVTKINLELSLLQCGVQKTLSI